jgi:dynein heavy chain
MVTAGVISYLGPFSKAFRQGCLEQWLEQARPEVRITGKYSLPRLLVSPIKVLEWSALGLPNDSFSVENACIFTATRKPVYLIDPECEAVKWLHRQGVRTIKPGPGLARSLQALLGEAGELMVQEAGECTDEALEKLVLALGEGRREIKLGEVRVRIHPGFRLVLTTSRSNPRLPAEMFIRSTVINFNITFEGLSDQLLGLAV